MVSKVNRRGIMSFTKWLIPVLWLSASVPAIAATASRTSAFEYDPVSGLLTKEIIEPGDSNLCLVTEYTYDAYGNKLTATTRNCNGSAGSTPGVNGEAAAPATGSDAIITPRTSSTTYDAQGRFPVTSTNALNQTETKVFDGRFGVVTSLTGPNGLTTTWTYDSFGRALTESRVDGTSSQTAYALCDADCPLATAQYKITSSQAGGPTNVTYYDGLSRVIQSETQDKDGGKIYSLTEYDHLGRTSRSSRPYKAGATPVWTTLAYDAIGRAISTTLPDNSVSTVTYNGLITVSKNALNQTKTEQVNSQGQTISVTDAAGKVLSYQYDAFGNLTKTTDAAGNITTITYDARGRKVSMNDPDQGTWSYVYDALGQLKKQTDAKNQVVTFQYDKLGRMTQRNEPDLISTWAYDTCDATLNPNGKCVGKVVKESSDNGYVRTYLYDAYGRNTAELDNVDTSYGVAKTFDSYGRVASLVYPTGFTVNNVYSSTGYLIEVRNASTQALYWRLDSMDASGNVTQQTYGNGIVTTQSYNANTGLVNQISAGTASSAGSITNQTFVYDSIGNLTQRYEAVTGLNESFGFDNLNRLTGTTAVSGNITTSVTVQYDAIGNILSKSDNGVFSYGKTVNGVLIQPHALTKITKSDGSVLTNTYDANGNATTVITRTLTWNSWNMPNSIVLGTKTYSFVYNSAHERVKQVTPVYTIYNVSPRLDTGIHVEKRIKKSDGSIEYVHSLYAGKMPFGTVTTSSTSTIKRTRYLHTDHLGSIVAITDETGAVVERRSYDAWGKRRNLDGTALPTIPASDERHGFTGHEELEDIGLIHMNGRLYNPATGRFLSADPTIQMPDDMQSYNRYSYINNNPLSAVDYSGYGFFSKVFKGIKKAFREVERGVSKALKNPVIRTAVAVGAAYYGGVWATNFFGSQVMGGAVGGFAGGLVAGRGDLKAALQGAITGAAFGMVGHGLGLKDGGIGQLIGHAAVGCGSSVMGGGSCASGALSAGFTKALAGTIDVIPDRAWRIVAASVVGGTASVLGGGKFENGAMTGAFSRMFNDEAGERRQKLLVPPGVSVDSNIQDASYASFALKGSQWFYDQVRNGGPWDYKQLGSEYENFGNYNYGATGAAFGFSEDTLLRMAGWAQTQAGTSQSDWGVSPSLLGAYLGVGGRAPYGDDPNDQMWIKQGIEYFQSTRKQP